MKVILIPELLLDQHFDNVLERAKTWQEVCAKKPEILVEHFKLELNRLRTNLKEAE